MPYDDTNIYKTARQKAGITQEKAASDGHLRGGLKAYETYGGACRPATWWTGCAWSMMRCIWPISTTGWPPGRSKVVPEVQIMELPLAAIRIINRVQAFAEAHRDRQLLCIAEDGTISEESGRCLTRSCRNWTNWLRPPWS